MKFFRMGGMMFFAFSVGLLTHAHPDTPKEETITLHTTVSGSHHFTAEIANTPQLMQQGLMGRTELANDRGMLFIYPRDRYISMWMKNTLIPLDMIFIKSDGIVHRIEKNTRPHSLALIRSREKVRAVLEVNAGTSDGIGLAVGDKVCSQYLGCRA